MCIRFILLVLLLCWLVHYMDHCPEHSIINKSVVLNSTPIMHHCLNIKFTQLQTNLWEFQHRSILQVLFHSLKIYIFHQCYKLICTLIKIMCNLSLSAPSSELKIYLSVMVASSWLDKSILFTSSVYWAMELWVPASTALWVSRRALQGQ